MKRFLVLCLVVAVSVSEGFAASLRNKRQVIPREFQNINIENYLKNERAVRFQLKCIIDDGPCDRIGKYLKVTIPELLVNQCANCDMSQRERAGKLVSHIQQNFPEEWERAVKKFQVSRGGLVKPEDAEKLKTLLGIELDPKLVGEPSTTAAPAAATTPVAKAAEVPSSSPVPVSTSAAPASSSEAPAASSSAAPPATSSSSVAPETSSIAAAVSSTTVAAVVPSSTTVAAVSSSTSEASSSTTAAAVASSSAAPAA